MAGLIMCLAKVGTPASPAALSPCVLPPFPWVFQTVQPFLVGSVACRAVGM